MFWWKCLLEVRDNGAFCVAYRWAITPGKLCVPCRQTKCHSPTFYPGTRSLHTLWTVFQPNANKRSRIHASSHSPYHPRRDGPRFGRLGRSRDAFGAHWNSHRTLPATMTVRECRCRYLNLVQHVGRSSDRYRGARQFCYIAPVWDQTLFDSPCVVALYTGAYWCSL